MIVKCYMAGASEINVAINCYLLLMLLHAALLLCCPVKCDVVIYFLTSGL